MQLPILPESDACLANLLAAPIPASPRPPNKPLLPSWDGLQSTRRSNTSKYSRRPPAHNPSANACEPPTSARPCTNKSVAAPASPPSFPTQKAACASSRPSSWKSSKLGKPPKLTSTQISSNNQQPSQPVTSATSTFTENLLLNRTSLPGVVVAVIAVMKLGRV